MSIRMPVFSFQI